MFYVGNVRGVLENGRGIYNVKIKNALQDKVWLQNQYISKYQQILSNY